MGACRVCGKYDARIPAHETSRQCMRRRAQACRQDDSRPKLGVKGNRRLRDASTEGGNGDLTV
jgi:hypothetical protein